VFETVQTSQRHCFIGGAQAQPLDVNDASTMDTTISVDQSSLSASQREVEELEQQLSQSHAFITEQKVRSWIASERVDARI